jgi:hypothetical protein
MLDDLKRDLESDQVTTRLEAVNRFEQVELAERFGLFDHVLGNSHHEVRESAATSIMLCPSIYEKYLTDQDPEVRITIIEKSLEIRFALSAHDPVISNLTTLASDPVIDVRCALARVLHRHATAEFDGDSRQFTLQRICPLLQFLLSDAHDDVRIAASFNLIKFAAFFGFDFVFERLYEHLHLLLTDIQWRVLNNGLQIVFGLGLICTPPYFDENLMVFLRKYLIHSCRKTCFFALSSLPALAKHLGLEWLAQSLIPELVKLWNSPNFLHRQTYLMGISAVVAFFPVECRSKFVFQPMVRALRDPVANVVILALDLLWRHREAIHPFRRQQEMRPILEGMFEHSSHTVSEKANALLAVCQ